VGTTIQHTLRSQVDLLTNVKMRKILCILWAIFLDAWEFFLQQIEDADPIPESQLKYTVAFLFLGQVPLDIMGIPLEQFGNWVSYPSTIT
jgi:hypothetical protein